MLLSLPYIPYYIPGLMSFLGSVSHSHFYMEPDNYKSQDVLIVEAGNFERDLVLDLSGICNKVYICNCGTKFKSTLPSNAFEVPSIMKVKRSGMCVFLMGRKSELIGFFWPLVLPYPSLSGGSGMFPHSIWQAIRIKKYCYKPRLLKTYFGA